MLEAAQLQTDFSFPKRSGLETWRWETQRLFCSYCSACWAVFKHIGTCEGFCYKVTSRWGNKTCPEGVIKNEKPTIAQN